VHRCGPDRELQIFNYFIERVMEKIRATSELPIPPGRSALTAALRALQLRAGAFANFSGKPVFDLCGSGGALISNRPSSRRADRAAPHAVAVVGDEPDSLNRDVLIEFVPIDGLGFDDQAPLHRRRIIKFEFLAQEALGNQHAGIFPPLLRRFALV
jgi:hypothetical protein